MDWEAGNVKHSFHSGHHNNVFQAKIMPYTNDRSIVTCAADGQVRHARIHECGKVETEMLGRHQGRAHKLAIEPGSPHIFYTCAEDGLVQHFDLRTETPTELFTCPSFDDKSRSRPYVKLNAIAMDPRNPNLFVVGGSDEYARLYDIRKYKWDGSSDFGKPADCFCPPHLIGDSDVGITGLAFSDQSELLVSYNFEFIYLFSRDMGLGPDPVPASPSYAGSYAEEKGSDMLSRAPLSAMDSDDRAGPQVYKGHRNCDTVKGVSFFGPSCEYIVSGSDCGRIFIWRKNDGELLRVMEADKTVVNCIEPHPHATMLASSGIDRDIKIWTPKAMERANLPVNFEKKRNRNNLISRAPPPELILHLFSLRQMETNPENGRAPGRDVNVGGFVCPSLLKFQKNVEPTPASMSFSNDRLLTSNSRSMLGQTEFATEIVEHGVQERREAIIESAKPDVDNHPPTSGQKFSPESSLTSSPRFIDTFDQPVMLNVYSPDRLAGELFFLDTSLLFSAEELSRAPAEVLGRSSHGTLYKATLDNGHMLTVKWLRVGLVKQKREFAKEVKRIGSIRHPNIVPLKAYYWGPREQERLILADYIHGDSLALHLYETTPRRYSLLSFSQRLKIAVDVARSISYLHDRGLPHGNLKPTNILLTGPDVTARLTDYGLHRLMTPAGISEQILNLGALGYCAPELATAAKPFPSFKADVYAFGVILMEMLTRRSAGDIISGQSGAVDLTDWVRLCAHEGRGMECFDRDIVGGEEPSKAMDEFLALSLRCIVPVNERPNIRQVFEELCSLSF